MTLLATFREKLTKDIALPAITLPAHANFSPIENTKIISRFNRNSSRVHNCCFGHWRKLTLLHCAIKGKRNSTTAITINFCFVVSPLTVTRDGSWMSKVRLMSSAVTGVLIILPSLTNATAAAPEGYPAAFSRRPVLLESLSNVLCFVLLWSHLHSTVETLFCISSRACHRRTSSRVWFVALSTNQRFPRVSALTLLF